MYKIFVLCLFVLLFEGCGDSHKMVITPQREKLASIPLELTTYQGNRQQFVEGDVVQFLLSLGSDAYIYMYYVDAANNIEQILPSKSQASHFYKAGYFLTIPEYDNVYRFIISGPFGDVSIWVFASDQALTLNESFDSIESIKRNLKQASREAYGEYVLNIKTVKR